MSFKSRVDGFDYVDFTTSDIMKCFRCGKEGQIRSECTEEDVDAGSVKDEELRESVEAGT